MNLDPNIDPNERFADPRFSYGLEDRFDFRKKPSPIPQCDWCFVNTNVGWILGPSDEKFVQEYATAYCKDYENKFPVLDKTFITPYEATQIPQSSAFNPIKAVEELLTQLAHATALNVSDDDSQRATFLIKNAQGQTVSDSQTDGLYQMALELFLELTNKAKKDAGIAGGAIPIKPVEGMQLTPGVQPVLRDINSINRLPTVIQGLANLGTQTVPFIIKFPQRLYKLPKTLTTEDIVKVAKDLVNVGKLQNDAKTMATFVDRFEFIQNIVQSATTPNLNKPRAEITQDPHGGYILEDAGDLTVLAAKSLPQPTQWSFNKERVYTNGFVSSVCQNILNAEAAKGNKRYVDGVGYVYTAFSNTLGQNFWTVDLTKYEDGREILTEATGTNTSYGLAYYNSHPDLQIEKPNPLDQVAKVKPWDLVIKNSVHVLDPRPFGNGGGALLGKDSTGALTLAVCSNLPTGLPPDQELEFTEKLRDCRKQLEVIQTLMTDAQLKEQWNWDQDSPQTSIPLVIMVNLPPGTVRSPIRLLNNIVRNQNNADAHPWAKLWVLCLLRYKPYTALVLASIYHTMVGFVIFHTFLNATIGIKWVISFDDQKVFFYDWISMMLMIEYKILDANLKKAATITTNNVGYMVGVKQAQQLYLDAMDYSAPDYAKTNSIDYQSCLRMLALHGARLNYMLNCPDTIAFPQNLLHSDLTPAKAIQLAIEKGSVQNIKGEDEFYDTSDVPDALHHLPPRIKNNVLMTYRVKLAQLAKAYNVYSDNIPFIPIDNTTPQAPQEDIPFLSGNQRTNWVDLDPIHIATENMLMGAAASLTSDELPVYRQLVALNPLDAATSQIVVPDYINAALTQNPPYQNVVRMAMSDIVESRQLLGTLELRLPDPAVLPPSNEAANPWFNMASGLPNFDLSAPRILPTDYWGAENREEVTVPSSDNSWLQLPPQKRRKEYYL